MAVLPPAAGGRRDGDAVMESVAALPNLAGIRAVIVDDDADWLTIVRMVLEHCGAVVSTAEDAESALRLIDDMRPDVMVVDLRMPARGGRWLTAKLREYWLRHGVRIPTIAVTAYLHAFGFGSLRATFDALFEKPVDLRVLCTTIAQVVEERRRAHRISAARG
jgi:CheY-like chemotaxis protein